MKKKEITNKEIQDCINTLDKLVENSELLAKLDENQRINLLKSAGKLSRPDREEIRKRNKDVKNHRREIVRKQEKKKRAATGIRSARESDVFQAPKQIESVLPDSICFGAWNQMCSKPRSRLSLVILIQEAWF